jgi:hypothetical protein
MIWKNNIPSVVLEIVVSLVPSISKLGNCYETQYNEQTNLMEVVEQLLIDFNPRNLNNRCRNGQDYDYENLMNIKLEPNQNVNGLQKQHLNSFLEIIISLVTSISKLQHC